MPSMRPDHLGLGPAAPQRGDLDAAGSLPPDDAALPPDLRAAGHEVFAQLQIVRASTEPSGQVEAAAPPALADVVAIDVNLDGQVEAPAAGVTHLCGGLAEVVA